MRKQKTEILGDVIRQVLQENHLDEHLYEVRLIDSWKTVLGTYISNYTESLYIRDKILYARISSAALRHELFLSKQVLLCNLNKAAGAQVINDIRFL